MSGIRGLPWEAYMSCVSGFSSGAYIDSNRRDSRICVTACLWPSAHRELNDIDGGLINGIVLL
jgi:hypothetical protein